MNKQLKEFISERITEFDTIPEDRKTQLNALSNFIRDRKNEKSINLIFICVHNSRRSHFSQVWAQVAAHYYGFHNVHCYSGGTEETEMYPSVGLALKTQGFDFAQISQDKNPVYTLKYGPQQHPIIAFSKVFDHSFNPQENFGAVMVCSAADTNCPFISTASARMLIPYEDPKAFDGFPEENEKYAERSTQIATELLFAFSKA